VCDPLYKNYKLDVASHAGFEFLIGLLLKVKITLEQAMKAQRGSRSMAVLVL
jgi:hypothetical protein